MLEATRHSENSFVTLTYAPEHLPESGSLVPQHLQKYLKVLRRSIEPHKIRYYAVGEYGDETFRPHYHLALFGAGESYRSAIAESWPYGIVDIGTLTLQSAQYVAGYVTKKMTKDDDPRLNGRYPEFARMSLKPGIGADAMADVATDFWEPLGQEYIYRTGDVPMSINHGKKALPLGRYLRQKLRDELEYPNPGLQSPHFKEKIEEMSAVYKSKGIRGRSARSQYLAHINRQKLRNLASKERVFKSRKTI